MEIGPLADSFPDALVDSQAQDGQTSFNVLIAYDDLAAGQQAMRLLARLGRQQQQSVSFQPQPWRFDLLADADWAQFAAGDALKADLLVISTSRQSDLPQAVQNWLTACLARKRGTQAAVVALFEPEQPRGDEHPSWPQVVQNAAEKAGLGFFAPLFASLEAATSV